MSDIILARVSQTLATEQTLEGLVRQLLEMLELVTQMESTYLTRVDTEARLQHILYARNSKEMEIPEGLSVPWDNTLCKRAIDEECFYSSQVAKRWGDCDAAQALGITTYLSTPVRLADGSLYGTLCAASTNEHEVSLRGEHVLQLFAGLIEQYIQRESLVTQLREANAALISHSYTDALTGLPNRRSLFENLPTLFSLARHLNRSVIIAYIDLDNFKVINDHYGHQAGDSFLQQIGQRLTSQRGSDDIVARLGGDEFLLAELGDSQGDKTHSDRVDTLKYGLDRQIQGEYRLGTSRIYYPGASVGVIEVDPQNIDTDSALMAADTAMYQVKKTKQKVPLSHID